jgi:hypothetical protein
MISGWMLETWHGIIDHLENNFEKVSCGIRTRVFAEYLFFAFQVWFISGGVWGYILQVFPSYCSHGEMSSACWRRISKWVASIVNPRASSAQNVPSSPQRGTVISPVATLQIRLDPSLLCLWSSDPIGFFERHAIRPAPTILLLFCSSRNRIEIRAHGQQQQSDQNLRFFVMNVVELNSTWKENSWSHPELNLNWRNLFYENDVAVRERSGNSARKYLSRLPPPPNFCVHRSFGSSDEWFFRDWFRWKKIKIYRFFYYRVDCCVIDLFRIAYKSRRENEN